MDNKVLDKTKFNIFNFLSTFARSLIEIFIALYLFNNGFSINAIIIFYLFENFFSIFLSYIFVRIGKSFHYAIPMFIGITAFIGLQFLLKNCHNTFYFILLTSFIYALYRRGYWVPRRFYITNIMPKKKSSGSFSIMIVVGQLGSIFAGYLGSLFLDNLNILYLTIISSILLLISVIPLILIKYEKTNEPIDLMDSIKKYKKPNYLAFSLYELTNLLDFIFPIYIAIYIKNTYIMAGTINAISNIAVIIFVLLYGRIIKNKNYFVLSSILLIMVSLSKLFMANIFILIIYFVDGLVKKMQNQSVNKIYFENQGNMDYTHYNLVYQIIESTIRTIVAIPLLFINNLKVMIVIVIMVIAIELIIYLIIKKDEVLN